MSSMSESMLQANRTVAEPAAHTPAAHAPPAPRIPLRERVNFRILGFIAIVIAPILWFAYSVVTSKITGGIEDLGNGMTKVELKFMSTFPFDQVAGKLEDVPAQFRALDGKKVVLDGEMWAPDAAGPEINKFQLCYSVADCCFSGPPQVQHFVDSTVTNGRAVPYYYGTKVRVTGTLHVNVKHDRAANKVASVYQLDVDRVEPF